jgi:3',5'-cyclic AMP phosphodiesterase CpdA
VPRSLPLAAGLLTGLVLAACGSATSTVARPPPSSAPPPPPAAPAARGLAVAAAGDIVCGPHERPSAVSCHDRQTAVLLDQIDPRLVLPLGDLQYPSGLLPDFRRYFAPTWGRWRARMKPVPGNHEWVRPPGAGYFDYFGARAGPRGRGWYSYDASGWHFVALNANCAQVECAVGSAQERWLRADLARHPRRCTLAYWHQPRFSSGLHGNASNTAPLWADLQAAGAELVLSGHDHSYERFAPQTASGRLDAARGVIQFVAGTGGVNHYPIVRVKPNSLAHNSTTFGVLELTLRAGSWSSRFVPEAGRTYTDSASGRCH